MADCRVTAFAFHRLRLTYEARARLQFPAGKPANLLRGALGTVFRQLACDPDCPGAKVCARRLTCSYARAFEPAATGDGPSGLGDWPRPFVFRARHLDGVAVRPGEPFWFDLHLFSLDRKLLADFVRTFEEMGRQGLGTSRARADLARVEHLDDDDRANGESPVFVSLAPLDPGPERIQVEFLTPTELKAGERIVTRPEFEVLFARVRDRISTLSSLYGAGPLDIDFTGMAARAAMVRMAECDTRAVQVERRSSRTGQTHSLGGFVGTAQYEGPLGEFVPYLQAARWTGVGRQTVWGKGEIAVR